MKKDEKSAGDNENEWEKGTSSNAIYQTVLTPFPNIINN